MNSREILNSVKGIAEEITENRRWLHANAEVGFELNKTVAFVKEKLCAMGYSAAPCGKNGLTATVGKGNKVFLLRADMDGLPVKEESGLGFCSENGNAHLCGHDMHTAMLLGAAYLLKQFEGELKGTVKLMFQPAEEILSGADNMIKNGVLDNPSVNAALMLHVMAGLPLKTGTVVVSSGGVGAPSADYFTINVQGKGCHGSAPQEGVDALSVAAFIVVALQELSARELGVNEAAALTIGRISAGTAGNVIADTAFMEGTMRCYESSVREKIKKRLCEITEGVALTFRAKATVAFGNGCPALENNNELSSCVEKYVKELLGEENATTSAELGSKTNKGGGSEDFSYISQRVPSVMLALASGEPAEGYKYPQHHPKVTFDERVLAVGSAVYAYSAMRWLEDNA